MLGVDSGGVWHILLNNRSITKDSMLFDQNKVRLKMWRSYSVAGTLTFFNARPCSIDHFLGHFFVIIIDLRMSAKRGANFTAEHAVLTGHHILSVYTRLLHPKHFGGIWSGLTPYRLPFDTLSEYPEPWLQQTRGSLS